MADSELKSTMLSLMLYRGEEAEFCCARVIGYLLEKVNAAQVDDAGSQKSGEPLPLNASLVRDATPLGCRH